MNSDDKSTNNSPSKPIMDVAKPGATAASPTSKPVITVTQPEVKDPMVAPEDAPKNIEISSASITTNPAEKVTLDASALDSLPAGPAAPAEHMSPEEFAEATQNKSNTDSNLANSSTTLDSSQDHTNPETGHKLVPDQATFGHVGKHKIGKIFVVVLLILIITGAGATYYFYLR